MTSRIAVKFDRKWPRLLGLKQAAHAAVVAAAMLCSGSLAAQAYMVQDLNPGVAGTMYKIDSRIAINDTTYGIGTVGNSQLAVFRLDPTTLEFDLVKAWPKIEDLMPGQKPLEATTYKDALLVAAPDGLWTTYGSTDGLNLLKAFSGTPPPTLPVVGEFVYFWNPGTVTLWKTDGTAGGTTFVRDLSSFGVDQVYALTEAGNHVMAWVSVNNGTGKAVCLTNGTAEEPLLLPASFFYPGWPLISWGVGDVSLFYNNGIQRTDGTPEGTYPLDYDKDLYPNGIAFAGVSGGEAYFAGGGKFLKTNPEVTSVSVVVKDFGYPSASIFWNHSGSNYILYVNKTGDSFNFNRDIWISDGSAEGTRLITAEFETGYSVSPEVIESGDTIYILYDNNINLGFGVQLFPDSGTTTFSLSAGDSGIKDYVSARFLHNGEVYCVGTDADSKITLAKFNGPTLEKIITLPEYGYGYSTPSGILLRGATRTMFLDDSTQQLRDVPLPASGIGSTLTGGAFHNNYAYLAANGSLWRTDSSPDSMVMVQDEAGEPKDALYPLNINSYLLCYTYGWRDSYAKEGTIWKVYDPIGMAEKLPINGLLFDDNTPNWRIIDGVAYNGSYKTDGTIPGTELNTTYGVSHDGLIITAQDRFDWTPRGNELYSYDSIGEFKLIKDLRSGSESSNPSLFVNYNGLVYFVAESEANDMRFWKTDGTAEGTTEVPVDCRVKTKLVLFNDRLYFGAYTPEHGIELWSSDGTKDGTKLVKDIYEGATGSEIKELVAAGNYLYFGATNNSNGKELFRSDGTADGTEMILDIVPGQIGSAPADFEVLGTNLYFTANGDNGVDLSPGREIWTLDLLEPAAAADWELFH